MGAFFFKFGAMGQMCQWNFKKKFNWGQWGKCVSGILKKILTGGICFKIGGNGTNVLVEFEKNFNWGHFF